MWEWLWTSERVWDVVWNAAVCRGVFMSRSQQRKQPFFVQLKTIGREFPASLPDDGRCCALLRASLSLLVVVRNAGSDVGAHPLCLFRTAPLAGASQYQMPIVSSKLALQTMRFQARSRCWMLSLCLRFSFVFRATCVSCAAVRRSGVHSDVRAARKVRQEGEEEEERGRTSQETNLEGPKRNLVALSAPHLVANAQKGARNVVAFEHPHALARLCVPQTDRAVGAAAPDRVFHPNDRVHDVCVAFELVLRPQRLWRRQRRPY